MPLSEGIVHRRGVDGEEGSAAVMGISTFDTPPVADRLLLVFQREPPVELFVLVTFAFRNPFLYVLGRTRRWE
jgi:hypothetical protein